MGLPQYAVRVALIDGLWWFRIVCGSRFSRARGMFFFARNYSLAFCLALLTAMPTVTWAREFRVADTQSADYPTVQTLQFMADRPGAELTPAGARRGQYHHRGFRP
jgi:hypothetical protein